MEEKYIRKDRKSNKHHNPTRRRLLYRQGREVKFKMRWYLLYSRCSGINFYAYDEFIL